MGGNYHRTFTRDLQLKKEQSAFLIKTGISTTSFKYLQMRKDISHSPNKITNERKKSVI
jgi:hypothetical protein